MPSDTDRFDSIGVIATDRPVLRSLWWKTCERVALHPLLEGPRVHGRETALTFVDLDTRGSLLAADRTLTGPIVILVGHDSVACASALQDERVRGVVVTTDDSDCLEEVVRGVVAGGSRISPAAASIVLAVLRERADAEPRSAEALTRREADVIRAMLDGHTIKSTSRALGIARKTVEAHRSRAFRKLGVRSQSEAVAKVLADARILVAHHR